MCEERLKSNSSEQVLVSNDFSLLSISVLTTSCRGRDGQGQTQPRQKDRHINGHGREEKCQSGEREETLKHQNGMFEEKKRMENHRGLF